MARIQINREDGGASSAKASRLSYDTGSTRRGPVTAVSPLSPDSFDAALEASELEDLLDELYDLSDQLSVFPTPKLIDDYRSVLTALLKRAMQGLRIKRDLRWRKTDRKLYITIERVEDAMDELEDAFLYEGNRTKALDLIEEIKGCMISILM